MDKEPKVKPWTMLWTIIILQIVLIVGVSVLAIMSAKQQDLQDQAILKAEAKASLSCITSAENLFVLGNSIPGANATATSEYVQARVNQCMS